MNNDLINRSALLEAISEAFFETDPTDVEQIGILKCHRIAREFPAVDAEPVRHGKWIEHIEPISWCEDDVDVFVECSLCGDTMPGETNYCPNCGAKMDVEVEG